MSDKKSSSNRLSVLQAEYKRYTADLMEAQKELEFAKKGGTDESFSEELLNKRKSLHKILTAPDENKSVKNISLKSRLAQYEFLSGIQVNNISMKYFPIFSENTDTSWFKFKVEANIDKLGFLVIYISNQDLATCHQDKISHCDIQHLEIRMDKKIHKVELEACLDYFSKFPSYIGLALSCLKDYNKLFKERSRIIKQLSQENPDFIQCEMLIEDDKFAYVDVISVSTNTSREYFTMKWRLIWDIKILTMKHSFKVTVSYTDKEFIDSVSDSFKKLCSSIEDQQVYISKEINEDDIAMPKQDNLEEERLRYFKNIIIAVKAADC